MLIMPTDHPASCIDINNFKFLGSQKVYCDQNGHIYEVRIMRLRFNAAEQSEPEYYVHYSGYDIGYNEWVPESRLYDYSQMTADSTNGQFIVENWQNGHDAHRDGEEDPDDSVSEDYNADEDEEHSVNEEAREELI